MSKVSGRKITSIVIDGKNVPAKECADCGDIKDLDSFGKHKSSLGNRETRCKLCKALKMIEYRKSNSNVTMAYESTRKRSDSYMENYRAATKEHRAEVSYLWTIQNPIGAKNKVQRRRARRLSLPNTLTAFQHAEANAVFNYSCALTKETENIHLEHFIPLTIGHGGTTIENTYPMCGWLNQRKGKSNPFTWFAGRTDIDPTRWDALVSYLADANGLSPADFRAYVDWCYANPRTIDQIVADNERYGYVVPSVTLWIASKELSSQIAV